MAGEAKRDFRNHGDRDSPSGIFPHLARAAFEAISARLAGVSASALANPPADLCTGFGAAEIDFFSRRSAAVRSARCAVVSAIWVARRVRSECMGRMLARMNCKGKHIPPESARLAF